mmetsp:Transcript_22533/g.69787  ORF Transcript_22533/g.69787 Transcript_22533/m.69787 type:complete len:305 (-) Transcript_22533:139-1053(-)
MNAMNDYELDSQMRSMGVPMDQRKRIIAAAKLGVPNPLKQLGLSMPNAPPPARSRSPTGRLPQLEGRATLPVPAAAVPTPAPVSSAVERLVRAPARPPRARTGDEDEQDLDGFLAGGRAATAAMARQKAAERARQEQAAREQAERDRQRQLQLEQDQAAERRRLHEERERQEEEKRREARRQARREEKVRRREEKKRLRAEEEGEDLEEDCEEDSEDDEAERRRRDVPSKGFFGQAYQGNQEQRKIWSEPIKGQVSNNYKGFTDADLDRRFGPPGGQAAGGGGQKLMTEEEVLALLRKGKASKS